MTSPPAYLDAKRELDDRSIDREMLHRVFSALPEDPLIIEFGAGTLTMLERVIEWGLLDNGTWVAVDRNEGALRHGRSRLRERSDVTVQEHELTVGDLFVHLCPSEVTAYEPAGADLLVGCAFFDLVDMTSLSHLRSSADRLYAPITYTGTTTFSPDHPDDDRVLSAYVDHMEHHRPGTPRGGQALDQWLSSVCDTSNSDWHIEPPYTFAESVVFDHVLDTIDRSLQATGCDPTAWVRDRRAQFSDGELSYTASNVDILGIP